MINSFCVALILVINAFPYLTHADSFSRSYGGRTREDYPDSTGSHITNFGNGNNKHNFVKIDETSDNLSVSGASFSNDNRGRPSVQKLDVNYGNPSYGGQGPNANYNPRATRTQITNIGNGEGNRNLFVFNDNRHDQTYPRNNQDGSNGYRGESNRGYQDRTRVITNIGKGPDNDNKYFVNGKRVYPNAANAAGVQGMKAIEPFHSAISDVTKYANNFGNGHKNYNRIIINGKEVSGPNVGSNNLNVPNNRQGFKSVNVNGVEDPSVVPGSLPTANSDGQNRQSQQGVTNVNLKEQNSGTRQYGTRNPAPKPNGYPQNNYPTQNNNQVKIKSPYFSDIFNDPSLKELPMRV